MKLQPYFRMSAIAAEAEKRRRSTAVPPATIIGPMPTNSALLWNIGIT
jgi:hypothetical protein